MAERVITIRGRTRLPHPRSLIFISAFCSTIGCKTFDVKQNDQSLLSVSKASSADIYSCSEVLQEAMPSTSHPLAGRYVITALGDAATLTWMAENGKTDVHEADCRFDQETNLTTCETYSESHLKDEPDMAPIWAFTIDHARENDVRVLGYNGKHSGYQASGKPMEFLGVIHRCADEGKRS